MAFFSAIRDEHRIAFYRQLATMLSAGLTPVQSFATLADTSPGRGLRNLAAGIGKRLAEGTSFSETLTAFPRTFPRYQRELLRVGEKSGRLAENLNLLADYLEKKLRHRRQVVSGLIYPAVVFHLAVFISPIASALAAGGFHGYLRKTVGFLALVYLFLFAIFFLLPPLLDRAVPVRRFLHQLVLYLPPFGGLVRRRNVADFTYAFMTLHEAGTGTVEGLRLASTVCTNEIIRGQILQAAALVEEGVPLSDAFARKTVFPRAMLSLWATGEKSGRLSEMLKKISEILWEEAERTSTEMSRWIPRLVYFGACVYSAFVIISIWQSYLNQLGEVLGW